MRVVFPRTLVVGSANRWLESECPTSRRYISWGGRAGGDTVVYRTYPRWYQCYFLDGNPFVSEFQKDGAFLRTPR